LGPPLYEFEESTDTRVCLRKRCLAMKNNLKRFDYILFAADILYMGKEFIRRVDLG